MQVTLLTPNTDRHRELQVWSEWMSATGMVLARYHRVMNGDDPFAYNETASVSILASSATVAGLAALAEYTCAKAAGKGRVDLYIADRDRGWSFEFKTWIPQHTIRAEGRLASTMISAKQSAQQLVCEDGDGAVAGLILPMSTIGKPAHRQKTIDAIRAIVADKTYCDLAWLISDLDAGLDTAFIFSIVAT